MLTYHTEILDSDAPIDVFAENALRGQHLALIEDDQGHITSTMQGSPNRIYDRGATSHVWRDAIYTAQEAIIAVIPVEITPQVDTLTVRLAGLMYSQAASPLSLSFKAYLRQNADLIDEVTLAWDTDPQVVTLELSNPRRGQTYQDQIIITMRNVLPTTSAAIGAAAWQLLPTVFILEDGTYGSTFAPDAAENGPDNVLYIEGESFFEVGNFDSGDDRGRVYGARKVYSNPSNPGALLAITGWAARAISLDVAGTDGAKTAPAQPELYPNIPVHGHVHLRHSLAIDRARDHRRYLSIRPSGDVLVGEELSQRTPFRRASGLNGILVRDSIYLDRGARGILTVYPSILYVTGDSVLNGDANPAEPDRTDTQSLTMRLLQWESGSSPTEIGSMTIDATLRGWHARSTLSNHRALVDARRWSWSRGLARLEETTYTSGAGYRWGTLALQELALLNTPRFDLALEGLTFDADLPLIVEIEAPPWSLASYGVLYVVGGSICWEGP